VSKAGAVLCLECYSKPMLFEDARSDHSRKLILIREEGRRCAMCSCAEWLGTSIPLELDHIDGDSDNSSRSNLRLVCPNCHALTPTYKGRNKGRAGTRGKRRVQQLWSPSFQRP